MTTPALPPGFSTSPKGGKVDAKAVAAKARAVLAGFTTGQRTVVALAVVGLVAAVVLVGGRAPAATYSPLFSNLAASDASAVVDKLKAQGEPYRLAEGGTAVLVPDKDVYALRLSLASAGLPAGGQEGYALLDKQGVTSSDFQQQVGYQRALEGELAKTVAAIDGVKDAVVHLVIPRDDVFADDGRKPSASVLVTTAPGATLTSSQVQAVVHLVSSSVEGLTPDGVTVADNAGHVLSAAGDPTAAAGSDVAAQTKSYQDRVAAAVQQLLDPVVGAGHSVVQVAADLDTSSTETTTQTPVVGPSPASSTTTSETYSGPGGTAAAGVLGPGNNGVPSASSSAGASSYSKTSTTTDAALGQQTVKSIAAPGTVKRLQVAVLLDQAKTSPGVVAQVQQVVAAAAGIDPKRGDAVQVTRLAFQSSALPGQGPSTTTGGVASGAKARAAGSSSLLTTGLLGLGLLVVAVGAVLGARRTTRQAVLPYGEVLELEEARRALLDAQQAQLAAAAVPALHPEPAALALPAPRAGLDDQLGELVDSQPEDVAALLRGWIGDKG